jgi:large subunit ribosomal protein L16
MFIAMPMIFLSIYVFCQQGQGQRMGGGKGAIDHYVTPVKAGRIIVEMAGVCEFAEVKPMLQEVANKLPFGAKVVSYEMMLQEKEEEKMREKLNINPFTFEYVIRNKMGSCHHWISPFDKIWFGKYL